MKSGFHVRWATTALLAVVFLTVIEGIRVYEGTNFEAPHVDAPKHKPHKSTGLSKKATYISKRSWNTDDDFKATQNKHDRRSIDGDKWKDWTKRKIPDGGFPALYKITFKAHEFVEYIKYTQPIPRLEEYTFCMWYKSNNMTHDHTLFTYALNRNEKLLRFWLNSADGTLRMAVRESLAYKVPANIRRGRWHHICQSWHSVLGEWQVFLDGRKIGAGVLPLYKETYIPEGGEVILSQDVVDKQKEHNNGLDGEVFGFNLVDEAVPGEQATFINSQYKPNIGTMVPPFKKLPPMKKTYQEIKAYISKLPSSPVDLTKGIDLKHYPGEQSNVIKRIRDSTSQLKRHKSPPRIRRPPVRKIIYYRNDRKLHLNQTLHPKNETRTGGEGKITEQTAATSRSTPNTYSIHSYRMGKDTRPSSNYEIYESQEDDLPAARSDEGGDDASVDRKTRGNFDLFVAREANKVYTLSNSVRDPRKQKYHFETGRVEGAGQHVADRRKSTEEESLKPVKGSKGERKHLDSIPVYEPEAILHREKRNAGTDDESLKDGFRRLPRIPESFIDLFTKNASKTEMDRKLDEFFPRTSTSTAIIEELTESDATTESFSSSADYESYSTTSPTDQAGRNFPPQLHPVDPMPAIPATHGYAAATPAREVKEFDPGHRLEERVSGDWSMVDRRKFNVTSGTDLIMRSYGLCTADRGSPIQNKKHLVISWAETPIRIFGGAEIENARNECGNF